jgi:hypothetical protein
MYYRPQIVATKAVNEVKNFFKSFKYSWKLLRGKVNCMIEGSCEWLTIKWQDEIQFSLDFFRPVKPSEILQPILGMIYSKYPNEAQLIEKAVKVWDKKIIIPKGVFENFKHQINNHQFDLKFENGTLTFSQSIPDTDNICELKINDEFLAEYIPLIADTEHERIQDFIVSIMPEKTQKAMLTEFEKEYEEIREYKLRNELEELLADVKNVKIYHDYDEDDDNVTINVRNEQKFKFLIKDKRLCRIYLNGKEVETAKTMSKIIVFVSNNIR